MEIIEKLCKEYTDLNQNEIKTIQNAALSLGAMANMFDADAFIDCPLKDGSGDSIVVAEAKPINNPSSYKRTVVGLVATKEKEPAVYRTFNLSVPTKFMKATTQENAHVVQTVEPIYCMDRVVGVFIIEQRMERITVKNKAARIPEKESSIANLLMEEDGTKFVDTIEEGILFVDRNHNVVFRNKAAAKICKRMGFISEVLGRKYQDICIVKDHLDSNFDKVSVHEVRLGNYFFNVKTVPVDRKDISYMVLMNDITSKKLQEQELILKSVAFKEMHHRVKNNLQTIAALLRLQRNNVDSEAAVQALNDTISRILAISSTHEILVETDMEDIKLNDIVASLKDNSILYYGRDDFKLDVEYYGGDFDIKFEKAVALALILNELMQNSIKYAFGGRNSGKIVLMTFQRRADDIELVFMDDGCGFDVEKIKSGSMGWKIINSMVKEKLKGHVSVKSGNCGTKVKIIF